MVRLVLLLFLTMSSLIFQLLRQAISRHRAGGVLFVLMERTQRWQWLIQTTPKERETKERSFDCADLIFRFRPRWRMKSVPIASFGQAEFVCNLILSNRGLQRENRREKGLVLRQLFDVSGDRLLRVRYQFNSHGYLNTPIVKLGQGPGQDFPDRQYLAGLNHLSRGISLRKYHIDLTLKTSKIDLSYPPIRVNLFPN